MNKWEIIFINLCKTTEIYVRAGKFLPIFKQIIVVCLIMFFPIISGADNITVSPADCNSTTLLTDTGPATLNADWEANTVNLAWYSDGTRITNDANAATQCTYDNTFTLPSQPSRTGYNFTGWKVRIFDLTVLDTSIAGTNYGYRDVSPYSQTSSNATSWGLDNDLTWATQFSYGRVYGIASCNATIGTSAASANWNTNTYTYTIYPEYIKNSDMFQSSVTGTACWCRVNGIIPTNETMTIANPTPWIYQQKYNSTSTCSHYCSLYCGVFTRSSADFRTAIYGQSQ